MEAIIKVSTAALRATSAIFSETGSSVSSLTQQMTSLVLSLSGAGWLGEAASTYMNKFMGLDADIQKINRKIQEHLQDLMEMADLFDEAESTNMETSADLPANALG